MQNLGGAARRRFAIFEELVGVESALFPGRTMVYILVYIQLFQTKPYSLSKKLYKPALIAIDSDPFVTSHTPAMNAVGVCCCCSYTIGREIQRLTFWTEVARFGERAREAEHQVFDGRDPLVVVIQCREVSEERRRALPQALPQELVGQRAKLLPCVVSPSRPTGQQGATSGAGRGGAGNGVEGRERFKGSMPPCIDHMELLAWM